MKEFLTWPLVVATGQSENNVAISKSNWQRRRADNLVGKENKYCEFVIVKVIFSLNRIYYCYFQRQYGQSRVQQRAR